MATSVAEIRPIEIMPGVQPVADRSSFATQHWTDALHVRFRDGFPEKIGGWRSHVFDYDNTINGKVRTIYSSDIDDNSQYVIGTHTRLYSLVGQRLVNITPFRASSTALANSLSTHYETFVSFTASYIVDSNHIRLAIPTTTAARLHVGDIINCSGFATAYGVPSTEMNAPHFVRAVGDNYVDFTVSSNANATNTQSVTGTFSSGLITVNFTAHGLSDGARVKMSGAGNIGGILAADINLEFTIRNVATDSFDIYTDGTPTSLVTGGGGASTVCFRELTPGAETETFGMGYGMGLYGVGLYGTSLVSAATRRKARVWSIDRFADTLIMTPGGQTGIYKWDTDTTAAPIALPNAPTAANYVFVSDNIVVALGVDGVPNRIKASDQGGPEVWTASSTNQVFEDDIEGAGELLCHLPIGGMNLLFTSFKTYVFRYIGQPSIWEIRQLDKNIGIASSRGGVVVGGVAYWIGQGNFYRWAGGDVEVIPSNTLKQATIWRHVFDDFSVGQKSKIFCWYNQKFNEIWWHYPSAASNEPDSIARLCLSDMTWAPDVMDRTAAEYPNQIGVHPRAADSNSIIYDHEFGNDADALPMDWHIQSPHLTGSKKASLLSGIIPDSVQTGNISVNIETRRYPQSALPSYSVSYVVTPTTEQIAVQAGGRFWRWKVSGNEFGQGWICGQWYEALQEGATQ